MLPLAVPGIVATAIYIFLTAWDELIFAWVLLCIHNCNCTHHVAVKG